jgi:membrane protein implicated in regulation of membrane protease activity
MKKLHLSTRIYIRYALFQIPSLILLILILALARKWVNLPAWFFWGTIAFWVAKDVLLFPFVWHVYERDYSKELQSLVGAEGIVVKRLAPSGYIQTHGELWQAKGIEDSLPVERGERVTIQGIEGLKLLVQPQKERKVSDR